MYEPIIGPDAVLAKRRLKSAEKHLPFRVTGILRLFRANRYRRDYWAYCNLKRSCLFDLAVIDIAALGALLEFDGYRMTTHFWSHVLYLADYFGCTDYVVELRVKGGWDHYHRDA
jgi:hypothetical protein